MGMQSLFKTVFGAPGKQTSTEDADGRRPLLTLPSQQSFGPAPSLSSYGTTVGEHERRSPEAQRRTSFLGRVEEEMGEDDGNLSEDTEWDLEERGYYGGSYKRTVALYSVVPVTSLIAFVLLVFLPVLLWPTEHAPPSGYPRWFPSPLPELLVPGALWALAHLLRIPLYTLTTALVPWALPGTLFFHAVYATVNQLLRLAAFAILRLRAEMAFPLPASEDAAFRRAWWAALGWAAVEVAVGVVQGYNQLRLYENVMVPEEEVRALLRSWRTVSSEVASSPEQAAEREDGRTMPPLRRSKSAELEEAIRTVIDKDVEQLVYLKEREELEELYGIPIIRIPVFVSCLLRIDSFVLSLGLTLTLAAAYLRSPLAFPPRADLPSIYSSTPLAIAFPAVVLIYLALALLHTPPVLPRIGVHSTAYIGLLVGLGSVFAGLGLWGALS